MSYGEKMYDEWQEIQSNKIIGLDTSGWVATCRGWRPDYPVLDKARFQRMSHLFTKESWLMFDGLPIYARMFIEQTILMNSSNGFCFTEYNFIDENLIRFFLRKMESSMSGVDVE